MHVTLYTSVVPCPDPSDLEKLEKINLGHCEDTTFTELSLSFDTQTPMGIYQGYFQHLDDQHTHSVQISFSFLNGTFQNITVICNYAVE